jgi:hypothetical protein
MGGAEGTKCELVSRHSASLHLETHLGKFTLSRISCASNILSSRGMMDMPPPMYAHTCPVTISLLRDVRRPPFSFIS